MSSKKKRSSSRKSSRTREEISEVQLDDDDLLHAEPEEFMGFDEVEEDRSKDSLDSSEQSSHNEEESDQSEDAVELSTVPEEEEENSEEEKEEEPDLRTVDDDDDERRLEVLRFFQTHLQRLPHIFDEDDYNAIEKEIHKLQNSKKRLWKKQCQERLKVLSEYERILGLRKNHPKLNNYFVAKHRKMQQMIAKLS